MTEKIESNAATAAAAEWMRDLSHDNPVKSARSSKYTKPQTPSRGRHIGLVAKEYINYKTAEELNKITKDIPKMNINPGGSTYKRRQFKKNNKRTANRRKYKRK